MKVQGEPLTILLVEDNPDHAELVKRSFAGNRIANSIIHVEDGEEALEYLFRRGKYSSSSESPTPHVVLLDLKLPKVDGIEVLKQIKGDTALRKIPVVVLTTSEADIDVDRAYRNYTNSYLVKPLDFDKFTHLMDDLGFYWLGWNCKPF